MPTAKLEAVNIVVVVCCAGDGGNVMAGRPKAEEGGVDGRSEYI